MLIRGLLVWLGLVAVAIVNGAIREAVIVPAVGESAARAVSSITLSAAILAVSWFTIQWMGPAFPAQAWQIGFEWLVLTLAFEFLVGHYILGTSWERLLADYNVLKGRIWVLVLVTTAVAPQITARARGLLLQLAP
jgi:hypothetical protein